ncbi:MAG: ASCH domain-containing protein [Dehalococcoidia bacterium]
MPLQFRREDRGRVASGEITVTYRLWKTAQVKAGKTYATPAGIAFIDGVELLPAAALESDDLSRTGFRSVEEVWRLAGEHTGSVVGPDTLLHRIEFHLLP